MNKWKEGDPRDCEHCAWGNRHEVGVGVDCMVEPIIVVRVGDQYCKQWAATRGLSSDWQDRSRMPAERAARYKCLCMDACTIMKNILGNTSIPFKEQRARIAQWERDLQGAIGNDVDAIK